MRSNIRRAWPVAAAIFVFAPPARVVGQAAAAPASRTSNAAPSTAAFTMDDALEISNATVADLSEDGRWAAVTSSVRRDAYGQDYRRDGDPTYVHPVLTRLLVVDTKSGAVHPVFADKRPIRLARWSPDGDRLATLVFNGDVYEPAVWDRKADRVTVVHLPAGRYVAENSDLRWSADGKQLVFAVHTTEWRKRARDTFTNMTTGPVFVQSSLDPFLAWDDVRRMANVRSVVAFDLKTNEMHALVPETMVGQYTLAKDGATIAYDVDIQKKTDYDSFNAEMSLRFRPAAGGAESTILATTKGMQLQWADDGKRYAYSKDGRVYVGAIGTPGARQIAGPAERKPGDAPPDSSKAARDQAAKERFSVIRFSPTGDAVLVSNRRGLWLVDAATSARDEVAATEDSVPTSPRVSFAAWTSDGRHIYLTSASRTKWERAVLRYDREGKQLTTLVRDARTYSALHVSNDGKTVVFSIASGNRPADIYVADEDLKTPRRLVESNPQLASKRLGGTDLVPFLDADGHEKYAVVYYPPDYQKGKTYPTIFNVYEDFFDDTFNSQLALLAGHGYVVVQPSVDFDIGFPGEAWLKGVTAAANKLIEMGITDSARMAVQGTSYGGYATNLLVTQTNRFKAAVNISGKVDLISFYTDSPRLGVRNVNAAEKTQDRIGATMWQQPQKYEQHSAVLFADRITTPLMLVTGAQDSNVPADNTREMYYALRRLGKEVVWVNYMNGGHGAGTATADDFLDMWRRVLAWYDTKLKGEKGKLATN